MSCILQTLPSFCLMIIALIPDFNLVYFNDCPAEPYIPIFLIVGGNIHFCLI